MKLIDLTNQKFNRLTVLRRSKTNTKQGKPKWVCQCDCGNITEVGGCELKDGTTKSCGCWNKEVRANAWVTHGYSKTRLYRIWCGMKERCYNPNNKRYKDYGGRGIKVCDEWLHDFLQFRKWALDNGYDETAPFGECTLDRANNNDGYYPHNCVWTTIAQQNRNKRNISHSQIYLTKKSNKNLRKKGDDFKCL